MNHISPPIWIQKLTILALFAAALMGAPTAVMAEDNDSAGAVDAAMFDQSLWKTSIVDFKKAYPTLPLKWTSAGKKSLRAGPGEANWFGEPLGELLIREGKKGEIESVSAIIYNQGDDGQVSKSKFDQTVNEWKRRLTDKIGSPPRERSTKSTTQAKGLMWLGDASAFLLEASYDHGNDRAEFIRIRVAPRNASPTRGATANRSSLKRNVVRKPNGDVFIEGVPMVDQGQKGYCVCATLERLMRYYGKQVDQHEIAQIVGATAGGTRISEMVGAMKTATSKFNAKTLVLFDYPRGISTVKNGNYSKVERGVKDFYREVKRYNRLAKKKNLRHDFPDSWDEGVGGGVSFMPQDLRDAADKELYKEVRTGDNSYGLFKSKIKDYVGQGVPLNWALTLGMFPEKDIPQATGGHMRMIIGYNLKTEEVIYSDSWGEGHEFKRMPMAEAFCMTDALVVMPPTR